MFPLCLLISSPPRCLLCTITLRVHAYRTYPAVWSDGKVSLAGLMSMQWARQEMHLTAVEYFGLAMLVGYAVVYIVGRRRNYQIAQEFITSVHGLFCSRFL